MVGEAGGHHAVLSTPDVSVLQVLPRMTPSQPLLHIPMPCASHRTKWTLAGCLPPPLSDTSRCGGNPLTQLGSLLYAFWVFLSNQHPDIELMQRSAP